MSSIFPLILAHDSPGLVDLTVKALHKLFYTSVLVHWDKSKTVYKIKNADNISLSTASWGGLGIVTSLIKSYEYALEKYPNWTHIWNLSGHCLVGPNYPSLESNISYKPYDITEGLDRLSYDKNGVYDPISNYNLPFNSNFKSAMWLIVCRKDAELLVKSYYEYEEFWKTRQVPDEHFVICSLNGNMNTLPFLYESWNHRPHPSNITDKKLDYILDKLDYMKFMQLRKVNNIHIQNAWYSQVIPNWS